MSMSLFVDTLKKYPNPAFVETGTFKGGGIRTALEADFQRILSVEIEPKYYEVVKNFFGQDPRIHLFLGSSVDLLESMIAPIETPITFWLDGHVIQNPEVPVDEKGHPLLTELEIIGKHPIKTHTILIDDRRVMGSPSWGGLTEEEIISALKKINPAYKVSYEDSRNAMQDILVGGLR